MIYNARKPQLAPAYDLLCTDIYPNFSRKMAMKIGGKYDPETVHLRHWHQLVPDTIVSKRNLEKTLRDSANQISPRARKVIASFTTDNLNSVVFDQILSVIEARAKHLIGTLTGSF